jgi:hypothetical protein
MQDANHKGLQSNQRFYEKQLLYRLYFLVQSVQNMGDFGRSNSYLEYIRLEIRDMVCFSFNKHNCSLT